MAQQSIFVAVGLPAEKTLAETSSMYERNLIGLVMATLLVLVAVWFGTNRLLTDKAMVLVNAANRMRGGNYSVRTSLPHNRHKLGQVAEAFDEMAERLEARDAELQRALHTAI